MTPSTKIVLISVFLGTGDGVMFLAETGAQGVTN